MFSPSGADRASEMADVQ